MLADWGIGVCQSAGQRRPEGTAEDSWPAVHDCAPVDACKDPAMQGSVSMCEWLCMQTSPGRRHN